MLRVVFVLGVILGLAAAFAAAGFYPWVDHPRLASRAQVLPNGGRSETFVMRLPADRIAAVGTDDMGLAAMPFPPELDLPPALSSTPVHLDHFKVRDIDGNVIGVAARHAIGTPQGIAVAWSLTFPSRGALWLSGDTTATALDSAVAARGFRPGEAWTGDVSVQLGSDGTASGTVLGGSDEFSGLSGAYAERWNLTGVGDAGELRGTIEIATRMSFSR
jgi:hypothetical protein